MVETASLSLGWGSLTPSPLAPFYRAAALVTWVNVLGIRTAAILQSIVTVLIVISGVLLISGAALFGDFENAKPLIATPATGILSVLIMVPALLVGFDVIPQSAEEIDLPPNRIGKLLVISVGCAVAWYVLIAFAVGLGLNAEQQASTTMATSGTQAQAPNPIFVVNIVGNTMKGE